jgi:hypothetical protein
MEMYCFLKGWMAKKVFARGNTVWGETEVQVKKLTIG